MKKLTYKGKDVKMVTPNCINCINCIFVLKTGLCNIEEADAFGRKNELRLCYKSKSKYLYA